MPNQIERRFVSSAKVAVRAEETNGKKKMKGYGAVFYDGTPDTEFVLWDDQYGRAVERVLPGAFDGSLSRPDDVRALFNHDANQVLGRTAAGTMRLAIDSIGLQYEIDAADTAIARDVTAHIERGDVSGSSFSFSIPPKGQVWTSTTDETGRTNEVREILAVELYDVGPVVFPAYDKTTAGIRAIGDVAEARAARDKWLEEKRPKLSRAAIIANARLAEIEAGE